MTEFDDGFQSVTHFMIRLPIFSIGAFAGFILFFNESFIVVGAILLSCLLIYKVITQLKCLINKKWATNKSTLMRNQILIGLSGIMICINLQRILVTFMKCDPYFFFYPLFFLSFISTVLYNLFVYECDKKYETDPLVNLTSYMELFAWHIALLMVMIKLVLTCDFNEKEKEGIISYHFFVELFSVFITSELYGVWKELRKLKDVDGVGQPARNTENVRLESVRKEKDQVQRSECENCKNQKFPADQSHTKIDCKVCRVEYSESQIPRTLKECGHTICERCIETLLVKNQGKFLFCPFCKVATSVNGPASLLQKNYGILEIINNLKN